MIGKATVLENSRGWLAKQWRKGSDGKPVKTAAAQLVEGSYAVYEFASLAELRDLLQGVTASQAISQSLPANGSKSGRVTTKAALRTAPTGTLARTKEHFTLQQGPGFGFLDHDTLVGEGGLIRADLWTLLLKVCPELAGAGVLWRPSGSSHIFDGESDLTGLRGQHVFVLVADVSDWHRVVAIIVARLWLAGHGRSVVSKSGSILKRCPIDAAPCDAARLIFAGGADCVPPLEQRRGDVVILNEGGFLDTSHIADLTREEREAVAALQAQSALLVQPDAARAYAAHRATTIAERLPEMMKAGVSAGEGEARIGEALDAARVGSLTADFVLTVVHDDGRHEEVTVLEVLRQRDRFHEMRVLDPVNPEHRGRAADGCLFLKGVSPIVYSFDDGGKVYRLMPQRHLVTFGRGSRVELIQGVKRVLVQCGEVFMTATGPMLFRNGRLIRLCALTLINLIGEHARIAVIAKGGEQQPCDLRREDAELVLNSLHI